MFESHEDSSCHISLLFGLSETMRLIQMQGKGLGPESAEVQILELSCRERWVRSWMCPVILGNQTIQRMVFLSSANKGNLWDEALC